MSALYPSLEDMKVDHMAMAQISQMEFQGPPPAYSPSAPDAQYGRDAVFAPSAPAPTLPRNPVLYPALGEYMGLDLSPQALSQHMPNIVSIPQQLPMAVPAVQQSGIVAPLSGTSLGLQRANVTHGIREVILCKDGKGKVGLRVRGINKGVFVVLVERNSPAALAGLRFGDQILQINGQNVAGFDTDKVHNIIIKASNNNIQVALRDRPFERTLTLHKDSVGNVGFGFKNGKIISIVKDSSAARNGLLIEHHILEINGQNVVGLKDKEIMKIIDEGGNIITLTIIPTYIYDHMMKCMAPSLVKGNMDHSIPEV